MSARANRPVAELADESDELEMVAAPAVPTPPPFEKRDEDISPWSVPPPGGFAELRKTLHTHPVE